MKTFITLVLIAVVAWGGWHLLKNTGTQVSVQATESPTATTPGLGGEAPEPSNYVEPTDEATAQGSAQTVATKSPTATTRVASRTPVPVVRSTPTPTSTSAPTSIPTASSSPSPSPTAVLAFRTIAGMNGYGEAGTMVISSTADGQTQISFNIPNAPGTGQQPAYIYRGAGCSTSNEVAYRLNPLSGGSSTTILPISASELLSQNSLQAVVHMNADSMTRVACTSI